ncbi:hypothetical protein DIS18_12415 [Algibacter marinivivus]|uniref:Uncharacterized protein n=1 Tax=Algibacter marinivivus TaxID=2100723 RepID=A0A2U2X2Q6_9FLAO|nr:hypothetical protein [Algibacter marinivivus]PWH82062.1 hypothetical protein DIS18_12415 [Algibacter marinivivus]
MKRITFILCCIISSFTFGQELTKKVGDIEIRLIEHYYKRNSNYELTKRKSNNLNRPFVKMFFDSHGNLLKKIKYGTHHNSDLKLIGRVQVFTYLNKRLDSTLEYYSECFCEKKIEPYFYSRYKYNKSDLLKEELTYVYSTDSLQSKKTFEYNSNLNKIKSFINPTYYYQSEFDSLNRITILKQIYEDKVRWDWKYNYTNNQRIGIFQTYYKDGKDYSKKEIQTFNGNGLLIETEEKYISRSGLDVKTKIFYDENGMISKIEQYEAYGKEYVFVSYTDIKIKSKLELNSNIVEKINEQINI